MPEPTPNLYGANTGFHKEVRNQPERRGRAPTNAPSEYLDASSRRHTADTTVDLRRRRPAMEYGPPRSTTAASAIV
ncbi:hypothetical protein GCM10010304_28140 [Streptomyces roseoviolaceus]